MFLVNDSCTSRENKIKQFLAEDPSLSALLCVIHFEWTVRRAIIALGTSSNVAIRKKLRSCHGIGSYKDLWKEEVFQNIQLRLPEVVKNWQGLRRSFKLRHKLVHGVTSCGVGYATERVDWAIDAANDVRTVCMNNGSNLDSRLPVRRSRS